MRDVTRRDFVESIFVAAAATVGAGNPAKAQSVDASKPFIDVHHHFVPPACEGVQLVSAELSKGPGRLML